MKTNLKRKVIRISNSSKTSISNPQPLPSRQLPLHKHLHHSRIAHRPMGLQEGQAQALGVLGPGCSTVRTLALTRYLPTRNQGWEPPVPTRAGQFSHQIISTPVLA